LGSWNRRSRLDIIHTKQAMRCRRLTRHMHWTAGLRLCLHIGRRWPAASDEHC
jgi:hypothetical protein